MEFILIYYVFLLFFQLKYNLFVRGEVLSWKNAALNRVRTSTNFSIPCFGIIQAYR